MGTRLAYLISRCFPNGREIAVPEDLRSASKVLADCDPRDGGFSVFSKWSGLSGGVPLPDTPTQWSEVALMQSPTTPFAESYVIDVYAYEQTRVAAAGSPVTPQQPGTTGSSRADFQSRQFSRLKAKVGYLASSGGVTRVFDIGPGVRFAVQARVVTVKILFPQPGFKISFDAPTQPTLQDGLILDTAVGGSMSPTDAITPERNLTNTITVTVPAATADVPVMVPEGARKVSIYQTQAGSVATLTFSLGRQLTALPVFPALGQINLGAGRSVNELSIPGSAGMILSGPADASDRVLTFVFHLDL